MNDAPQGRIAAENYLQALAENGIDYLFVNPGTDFPPIVEGLARAAQGNAPSPKPMVIPHENCAVGMAHGYTMITGRPQAVMLHVNVGTANAITMMINASRDRTPILLTSGRTPITENGPSGTRSNYIHWSQEMFDQASMLREVVKWDYEMRRGDQADAVVNRALELAMTSPKGPVYLSLPREALGEQVALPAEGPRPPRARARVPHPNEADIATLAGWIAAAKHPLIITASAGRDPAESVQLARIAERFALPVIGYNARYFTISGNHPMYMGSLPGALLKEADLVIVLECDVPWIPSKESPAAGARIVQIGEDPIFARYPMRSFPSDLSIAAGTGPVLTALEAALTGLLPDPASLDARRASLTARHNKLREGWDAEVVAARGRGTINMAVFNHGLRSVVDENTIIVNEYSFRQEYCPLSQPGSLFGLSSAGGLGWGFPAALGAKLAAPEKLVVAVLGDGAYMFANPTACHWVSAGHKLPILTVLFNNCIYNAVRRATLDMYGQGVAAADDGRLLADLQPSPDFEHMMQVHGGHAERVEHPDQLEPALQRAAAAVRGGQQALVNVICVV
jgi:acetolactate synthase-1/2/3 large subunit